MEKTFAVESLGEGRYRLGVTYPDFVGLLSVAAGILASRGVNIIRGDIDTIGAYAWIVFEVSSTIHLDWDRLERELFDRLEKAYAGRLEEVQSELFARVAK
jgi:hypothetical protein